MVWKKLPAQVTVMEVGLRDGLQIIDQKVTTEDKLRLLKSLIKTGLRELEVTSFVHPKAIPQLSDAEELLQAAPRQSDVNYWALVPNEKGVERAAQCQLHGISVALSASESHNLANMRMSTKESIARLPRMVSLAREAGLNVRAGIGTSFGCPFEGNVPSDRVVEIVSRFVDLGVDKILLADTTGMADPLNVTYLLQIIRTTFPEIIVTVHFHNTRGAGMANVLAALLSGITTFDSSIGGLGGCPFAPNATGNVCTEDMVNMFHNMGINTGINLEKLVTSAHLAENILGFELPGQVMKAGQTDLLHPYPPQPHGRKSLDNDPNTDNV